MERNLDAVEIAAALDKERQEGKVRSQLHGIPILVNDVSLTERAYIWASNNIPEYCYKGQDANHLRVLGSIRIDCTKRCFYRVAVEKSWGNYHRLRKYDRRGVDEVYGVFGRIFSSSRSSSESL